MSNMKYMYNVQYMYNRRICLVPVEYLVPSPSICMYYSRMFREGLSYSRLGQSPSILTYSIRASCGVKGCLRWIHSFLLYLTKVHREAAGVSHCCYSGKQKTEFLVSRISRPMAETAYSQMNAPWICAQASRNLGREVV